MKGYILDYTVQTNSGIISGDDNQRYNFRGADWKETEPPRRGMRVDFDAVGDASTEIYGFAAPAPAPRQYQNRRRDTGDFLRLAGHPQVLSGLHGAGHHPAALRHCWLVFDCTGHNRLNRRLD